MRCSFTVLIGEHRYQRKYALLYAGSCTRLTHVVPPGLRLKSSGCFQLPILMWKTAAARQSLAAFIRDFIGLATAAFHPAQTR